MGTIKTATVIALFIFAALFVAFLPTVESDVGIGGTQETSIVIWGDGPISISTVGWYAIGATCLGLLICGLMTRRNVTLFALWMLLPTSIYCIWGVEITYPYGLSDPLSLWGRVGYIVLAFVISLLVLLVTAGAVWLPFWYLRRVHGKTSKSLDYVFIGVTSLILFVSICSWGKKGLSPWWYFPLQSVSR